MIDLIGDVKKRTRAIAVCIALGLASFAAAFLLGAYDGEAHAFLEKPGGMVIFAFVGCWVLIIVAKIILTPIIQRDEDYYERGSDDQDA